MSERYGPRLRLLFLTEWFEPEPVFKGLRFARGLRDRGFSVEVATAFPNYPGGEVFPGYRVRPYQREVMGGIAVHRLFVSPSHNRSVARRMLTYLSFFMSSLVFLLLQFRRYDVAYVYHPPIMPGFAAALAGLVHRRPFVLEIQDLWPDSVASSGMGPSWTVSLIDWLCRFTYKRAATIVCQSNGMMQRLIERGVPAEKLVLIYNWSNYVPAHDDKSHATVPSSIEASFAGRFNVVYGGNIGQAQALETVIEAAALATRDVPALRLHLVGNGIVRDRIVEFAAQLAPDGEVLVHEAISPRAMDRVFDQADALVLHLKDDPLYDITIPSKTQHYLSVGKPIIAGIAGEAAAMLRESGAATITPNGDCSAMARAMVTMAKMPPRARARTGSEGRAYYDRHLAFDRAMDRTVSALSAVVPSK